MHLVLHTTEGKAIHGPELVPDNQRYPNDHISIKRKAEKIGKQIVKRCSDIESYLVVS